MSNDIQVIEPIRSPKQTFQTTDAFNLYYARNKTEMDALTTYRLNKLYRVDGYIITRIKGQLSLKRMDPKHRRYFSNRDESEAMHTMREELDKDIDGFKFKMNDELRAIKDSVNKITDFLKQLCQGEPTDVKMLTHTHDDADSDDD